MNNILVVGDLHCPFDLTDYLDFNKMLYKKYNCNKVVFIGDVIDGHAWSYHETNPDGKSANDEIEHAKKRLFRWYRAFPNAIVTMGNHDLLIRRKGKTHGLPSSAFKPFGEFICAPDTWKFVLEHTENNVKYVHGSTGNAIKRARDSRISTVQGHLHSQCFVEWSVSEKDRIFGLQVGCGIDRHKYAFEYGKDMARKPVIGSGLVLENGRLPLIEIMKL